MNSKNKTSVFYSDVRSFIIDVVNFLHNFNQSGTYIGDFSYFHDWLNSIQTSFTYTVQTYVSMKQPRVFVELSVNDTLLSTVFYPVDESIDGGDIITYYRVDHVTVKTLHRTSHNH